MNENDVESLAAEVPQPDAPLAEADQEVAERALQDRANPPASDDVVGQ